MSYSRENRDFNAEEVATVIAVAGAEVRKLCNTPYEAVYRLTSALGGRHNELPPQIVGRLIAVEAHTRMPWLPEVFLIALEAGILGSAEERAELLGASSNGDLTAMRTAALGIKIHRSGEDTQLTLGERLGQLTNRSSG